MLKIMTADLPVRRPDAIRVVTILRVLRIVRVYAPGAAEPAEAKDASVKRRSPTFHSAYYRRAWRCRLLCHACSFAFGDGSGTIIGDERLANRTTARRTSTDNADETGTAVGAGAGEAVGDGVDTGARDESDTVVSDGSGTTAGDGTDSEAAGVEGNDAAVNAGTGTVGALRIMTAIIFA